MEENFTRARFEGIRQNKYLLKKYRNRVAKEFIKIYVNSKGEITPDLQKATCVYLRLDMGSLDIDVEESDFERISKDKIEKVYKKTTENSNKNFIKFYESYLRKIEYGYGQDYVENALEDLKFAYYTYRKTNNPDWNLKEPQITLNEMTNLYNLLVQKTQPTTPTEKIK